MAGICQSEENVKALGYANSPSADMSAHFTVR